MTSVVCVGSAVLDRIYVVSNLPEPDGEAFVTDYYERAGGVAANGACALASLDYDSAAISRVGRDNAAAVIIGSIEAFGVGTSIQRGEEELSYTLILRGPEGGRMIIAGGDSIPQLRLGPADEEQLRAADCVFTSAYAPDPVVRGLVALREAGELEALVFDLAGPLSELEDPGAALETIDRVATIADLFVTNEVAARSYLEQPPEAAAQSILDAGAARVAVTTGAADSYLAGHDAEPEFVPAVESDVVDTTGAGDQFKAALVHAWMFEGLPSSAAGRIAASAAAQNCTDPFRRTYMALENPVPIIDPRTPSSGSMRPPRGGRRGPRSSQSSRPRRRPGRV